MSAPLIVRLDKPIKSKYSGQECWETQDGVPVWGRNEKGDPICNSLLCGRATRGTGKRCQQSEALNKTGRCYLHNSPGAPLKTAAYSKALKPLGLQKPFEEAMQDPELSSHRENVALFRSFAIAQLESGVNPTASEWDHVVSLFERSLQADKEAFADMGEALRRGQESAHSFERLMEITERGRRHKDSEGRREKELRESMSERQRQAMILALWKSVEEEEPDPRIRKNIGLKFLRTLRLTTGGSLDVG